jgi:hypothetical protein
LAIPSAAQTVVPPSLAGEELADGTLGFVTDETGKVITGDCNRDGISTITLMAEGAAAGPYPGTFVETGTFSFGPQSPLTIDPGVLLRADQQTRVPLLNFDVSFTINSPVGQVQGTKTLVAGQAACGSETDPVTGAVTTFVYVEAELRYEATISTVDGQFTDSGTATVYAFTHAAFGAFGGGSHSGVFIETFITSDGVIAVPVAPVCTDDDSEYSDDDDDEEDDECDDDDDDDGDDDDGDDDDD